MVKTTAHLCKYVLKVDEAELQRILDNINSYYYERRFDKLTKTGERKRNKDGSYRDRIINPSTGPLKEIQERLKLYLTRNLSMPPYAYGGVRKRDNVLNAAKHKGKKFVFQTDLQDFFPFVSCKMVCSMLVSKGLSMNIASTITKLTTYNGHLPQGASTSSLLANLVFEKAGNEILEFCKENGLTFTTFVDDVAISSPTDFKEKTNDILSIIKSNGFRISHGKTTYKSSAVEITGVKCKNNYLTVPDGFREKLNALEGKSLAQVQGIKGYKKRIQKESPKTKTAE